MYRRPKYITPVETPVGMLSTASTDSQVLTVVVETVGVLVPVTVVVVEREVMVPLLTVVVLDVVGVDVGVEVAVVVGVLKHGSSGT